MRTREVTPGSVYCTRIYLLELGLHNSHVPQAVYSSTPNITGKRSQNCVVKVPHMVMHPNELMVDDADALMCSVMLCD